MVLVAISVAARIGVAILTELSGYAVDVCFHCLSFVYVPIGAKGKPEGRCHMCCGGNFRCVVSHLHTAS